MSSLSIQDDVHDKLKPIRLHVNYTLSSKSEENIVPPILDPTNSTFDYNVKKRIFPLLYLYHPYSSDSDTKRLWY